MILKKITIENFRSIEKLEIEMLEISNCKLQTFFGINGTGKSNILKAISLLDSNKNVNYDKDCNKNAIKNGNDITIKFLFKITKDDNYKDQMNSIINDVNLLSALEPLKIEKVITFNEKSARNEYYRINPSEMITTLIEDNKVSKNTMKKAVNIFVAGTDIFNRKNIEKHINAESKAIIDGMIPEVILWEPSNSYLITNQINLEKFKQNPDVSIPLKNIFHLAGYDKDSLVKNVQRIQTNGDVREEFEVILSKCITEHINNIWSEHKINIKVRLENHDFCEIYIQDKDTKSQKFNMEQRSDGFKQFISILLSLSVKNDTNQLKNKIILLDEPEKSLHPGSIKCLRDELLRISKNNNVLASSHSIFMVDKKNLDRHYTVTKENGKTVIEQVNPENPIQDEVIYNSLGASIFELIEPNVLIFEGRTDKDVFDAFSIKFKEQMQPARIQSISATGAKQIPKYMKFFHNKLINGFVVVDSDREGRSALKSIRQQDKEFNKTIFELKDLSEIGKSEMTMEDILPENLIFSCANELYGINFDTAGNKSILIHIKETKKENSIETDWDLANLKEKIVKTVLKDIESMEPEELKQKYSNYIHMVSALHSNIKEIS